VPLIVGDVPHEPRLGRVRDLDDRGAVPLHLPGDRVEDRLIVALAVVGCLRVGAVVRRVADVDPVAVGGIRLRGDDERLAPLEVVITDEPDVVVAVRSRVAAPGCDRV
jgi:hypothetical protein